MNISRKMTVAQRTRVSVAALVFATCGLAQAAEDTASEQIQSPISFNEVDRDTSGSLHWQEVKDAYGAKLESLHLDKSTTLNRFDKNGDDVLEPQEYAELSRTIARAVAKSQDTELAYQAGDQRQRTAERTFQGQSDMQAKAAVTVDQLPADNADRVEGFNVINRQAEIVGEVEKVIVDDGKVQNVVVSIGGFMGIGDKDVVVDARELRIDVDHVVWNTPLTEHRLDNLPEYSEDEHS
ncbi:PRC-barrel domain-containing protein [Gilvimarinus agarilyticus]|uniref:PRC-barrel domain-containing protein n=1 Tax=Gilvimarinus sp. 2_MG-2023 TaxID=3062666 RepID=UPI001C081F5B|nr:PRC-barrel domain-containing protein [Gilvimarinus sp. 2_MG-2023]MBU2887880.1 PRC-barrel domain-containing protein [Gilvimarinus agarilyticus]MDO6572518.1 PRC-barrel domain-containing protein [Gilvimarinus sp. 2_MG-2023]